MDGSGQAYLTGGTDSTSGGWLNFKPEGFRRELFFLPWLPLFQVGLNGLPRLPWAWSYCRLVPGVPLFALSWLAGLSRGSMGAVLLRKNAPKGCLCEARGLHHFAAEEGAHFFLTEAKYLFQPGAHHQQMESHTEEASR